MQFTLSKLYEILLILRFIYFTKKKEFTLSKLYDSLFSLRSIYLTKKNWSLRSVNFTKVYLVYGLFI